MMLAVDGREIAALRCALLLWSTGDFVRDYCPQIFKEEVSMRALGDELGVIEDFLRNTSVACEELTACAVMRGPGSDGALRSTLACVNAFALARGMDVYSARCDRGGAWILESPLPFALPVYEQASRVSASYKDALGRVVLP